MEKQILFDFGDVRIVRYDALNIEVITRHILKAGETIRNPKTGVTKIREQDVEKWETFGYYPNTQTAIEQLLRYDLLLPDQKRTIGEYTAEIRKAIEGVKTCIRKQS